MVTFHYNLIDMNRKVSAEHNDIEDKAVVAAIAAAIYEITDDIHDIEPTVLTIDKVSRRYSPWSSKIHSIRELPKK